MLNDQTQQAAVNPVSKKTHIVKITKSVEKATKTPVKRSKKTPRPVEKVTDAQSGMLVGLQTVSQTRGHNVLLS